MSRSEYKRAMKIYGPVFERMKKDEEIFMLKREQRQLNSSYEELLTSDEHYRKRSFEIGQRLKQLGAEE